MNVKASYVEITKRVAAGVVDQIIYLSFYLLVFSILFILSGKPLIEFFDYISSDTTSVPLQEEVLGSLLCMALMIVLETLMIIMFGSTPGKLLIGIRIKNAVTFDSAALTEIVIRSTLKVLLLLPSFISDWFLILPILVLVFARFDKHKRTFYDKITRTAVIDCKPGKLHLNLNCTGIIKRAYVWSSDLAIIRLISRLFYLFVKITFGLNDIKPFSCLWFLPWVLLSIIFGVFMVRRYGGTPGQLLWDIRIKDASTLENITLLQAIVRHIFCLMFVASCIVTLKEFFDKPISEWLSEPFPILPFVVIILIFISAVFDRHKRLFYDIIVNTVAIRH
ncbi:RDD family protein [Wolbachia endosymbiont of Ctenocephalides felis wCfeJ]|uniref:RDD family protein n=1 Tax=Wolbachia endosymbiont of Ctenocephalides felis wCfeJ TaxID=2732594 RepID=UPI00144617ED|nr:RDD family protein [Wolbachia endosymbiont of Ctenocephalides felis wCfeJ]